MISLIEWIYSLKKNCVAGDVFPRVSPVWPWGVYMCQGCLHPGGVALRWRQRLQRLVWRSQLYRWHYKSSAPRIIHLARIYIFAHKFKPTTCHTNFPFGASHAQHHAVMLYQSSTTCIRLAFCTCTVLISEMLPSLKHLSLLSIPPFLSQLATIHVKPVVSSATQATVYPSAGCVMVMTTARMIRMKTQDTAVSRHACSLFDYIFFHNVGVVKLIETVTVING